MPTFATRSDKNGCSLRYGVMVAQEILALLVWVRVLISQLNPEQRGFGTLGNKYYICNPIREVLTN